MIINSSLEFMNTNTFQLSNLSSEFIQATGFQVQPSGEIMKFLTKHYSLQFILDISSANMNHPGAIKCWNLHVIK